MEIKSHDFEDIISNIKTKIYEDYGITVDKVLIQPNNGYWTSTTEDEDGYSYNFCIKSVFVGINKEDVKSLFSYSCDIIGTITKNEFERQIAWDYLTLLANVNPKSIYNLKVTNLITDAVDNHYNRDFPILGRDGVINEVIYSGYGLHNYQIIYQAGTGRYIEFYYLELNSEEGKWRPERIVDIEDFIEENENLYLHPYTNCPESDFKETPYIKVKANKEVIEKIKNRVEETKRELDKAGEANPYLNFLKFSPIYKTTDFLIYKLDNDYRVVLNPDYIYEDEESDISDIFHVNNYYKLGITSDIKEILPVSYGFFWNNGAIQCDEYKDDRTFIRSFGNEGEPDYWRKPDDHRKPSNGLYIVRLEDGTQGFMFLNTETKVKRTPDDPRRKVKRLTYISQRNENS